MMMRSTILATAFVGLLPQAFASSSDWFETEGGRVRLVTADLPDAEGRLKGVLDVDLQPGWKTYWRDPGDAGVPPTIDISRSVNLDSATLDYPAPERHDEGDFTWAGYSKPVGFPVTFKVKTAGSAPVIEGDVFLGICQTICIPVKAEFLVDPASDPDNAEDAALVAQATAALPAAATADFGATFVSYGGGKLVVQATLPGDSAGADLFIAAIEGYYFGTPEMFAKDGKTFFSMEADGPAAAAPGTRFNYTLVTKAGAVSGDVPLF